MDGKTAGELLFEKYLAEQDLVFESQPNHSHTLKRPDYAIQHPIEGPIIAEVKDIYVEPPASAGVFDPYKPIRSHINAAQRQLKAFKGRPCIVVMVRSEGSFVELSDPRTMLGAMYGDSGFSLPYNAQIGHHDPSQLEHKFIVGKGKMIQIRGVQNTTFSAIVSLHDYDVQALRYNLLGKQPGGLDALIDGSITYQEEKAIGVTVWENAYALRPLPRDLFRGEFDEWWSIEGDLQERTYMGQRLKQLLDIH